MVEREECPHALQRKATGGRITSKVVRRRLAGRGQAWPLGRQHQLLPGLLGRRVTLQQMSCGNNARVEGLDVTLDNPVGVRGRVLMNSWMWVRDSSKDEFRVGPLVLQREYSERFLNQILPPKTNEQTMLKADNYNEYNYNQASGEKHMEQRRYTFRGLSMRSRSEVKLRGLDQKSSYEIGTRDLTSGSWWRKINSRAVSYRIR